MKITIWGCRGSIPVPGQTSVRYGGNTTCIEIRSQSGQIYIVDAGSGIRNLGKVLSRENEQKQLRFFFTHAHWDHLLGFPFFTPLYSGDYKVTFCSGPHAQGAIHDYLTHQMAAPYFPVELSALRAEFIFECMNPCHEDRYCCFSDIQVRAFPVNHPNGGFGYKFVEGEKTFIFVPDNEIRFHHEDGPDRAEFVEQFRGADLLIHDSQYTEEEYGMTRGWGHSTFADAVDLAMDAGVKKLGLFHHDPDRSDDELDRHLAWCRKRIEAAGSSMDCFASTEGMVIDL